MIYPPIHWPFHFPSEGTVVHGAIYAAQGAGPNACLLMIPEVGGYDRLTSLFNPILMVGISVAYIYPRGMWDQSVSYTLDGALIDIKGAVDFLRSKEMARFRIDPERIALGGMSGGGGLLGLIAAAEDVTLPYAMAVSPPNFAATRTVADMHPRMWALKEASNGRMDPAMIGTMSEAEKDRLDIILRVAEFVDKTLLLVNGARDEQNPVELSHNPLVTALRAAGASRLTEAVLDSDHLLLTKRLELEKLVISWLKDSCKF